MIFYRIEVGGKYHYLFGTIHIANNSIYPLEKKIEAAFEASDRLLVEINLLDAKQRPETNQKVMRDYDLALSKKQHLKAVFSDFDVLNQYQYLMSLTPFEVLSTLEYEVGKDLGYEMSASLDLHWLVNAFKKDKAIDELEGVNSQFNLIEDMNGKWGDVIIDKILHLTKSEVSDEISQLFEAVIKADESYIIDYYLPDFKENDLYDLDYYKQCVVDRNIKMNQMIMEYLKKNDQSIFVAIGAGHLLGPDGLVSLLRNNGYQVESM